MVTLHCRTSIDEVMQSERFPKQLPVCPAVGDIIQSGKVWKDGCQVEMKVLYITWKQSVTGNMLNFMR